MDMQNNNFSPSFFIIFLLYFHPRWKCVWNVSRNAYQCSCAERTHKIENMFPTVLQIVMMIISLPRDSPSDINLSL